MNNECEGCFTSISFPDISDSNCYYSKIKGCPCTSCLVKVMCIEMCPDLDAHVRKINYIDRGDPHG